MIRTRAESIRSGLRLDELPGQCGALVGVGVDGPVARLARAVVVATVAFVLAACSAVSGAQQGSGGQGGGLAGQPLTEVDPSQRRAAPIVSGPAVAEGAGEVNTERYLGKVVVLNVWGSWCAPCRKEAPDLAAASRETRAVAQFVGLDIRDYDPAPARAFIRAFGVPYPQIYDPQGTQLVKFTDLPPSAIPSTVFIDRRGRIAARVVGATTQTTLTQIVHELATEP